MTDIDPTMLADPGEGPMNPDEAMRRVGGAAAGLVRETLPWTVPTGHKGQAGPTDPEPDYGEAPDGTPWSGEEFAEPATFEPDAVTTAAADDGPLSVRVELPDGPMRTVEAGAPRWKAATVHIPAGAVVLVVDAKPNRRSVKFPVQVGASIAATDAEATHTDTRVALTVDNIEIETSGEIWATATGAVDLAIIELFEH